VGEADISEFLSGIQKCVVGTLKELFERCATRSAILRNSVAFNPAVLISSANFALSRKLKNMLQNLVSLNIYLLKKLSWHLSSLT